MPLLVPMATRVRTCLYACLWERNPVGMRGQMWTYPHLDPSLLRDQGLEGRCPEH